MSDFTKEQIFEINYRKNFAASLEEQAKIVAEVTGREIKTEGLKQIFARIDKGIFLLYEDGTLLHDFKPCTEYGEGIEGIFAVDADTAYLIFKDNRVKPFFHHEKAVVLDEKRYDKVEFDAAILAMLEGNKLTVVARAWGRRATEDAYATTFYEGVKDVKIVHPWEPDGDYADYMMETELHIFTAHGDEIIQYGTPIVENPILEEELEKHGL